MPSWPSANNRERQPQASIDIANQLIGMYVQLKHQNGNGLNVKSNKVLHAPVVNAAWLMFQISIAGIIETRSDMAVAMRCDIINNNSYRQ